MEVFIIGTLGALGIALALIRWCHDPLEDGFKQAQAWQKNQEKLRQVLGKNG